MVGVVGVVEHRWRDPLALKESRNMFVCGHHVVKSHGRFLKEHFVYTG